MWPAFLFYGFFLFVAVAMFVVGVVVGTFLGGLWAGSSAWLVLDVLGRWRAEVKRERGWS
jgi:MFS-type transporter involved in bile tolerance (Atg22 family)